MNRNIIIIDSLTNNQIFHVMEHEQKTFVIFLVDGKNQTGEVKIVIDGEKANVKILGIIIGSGNQKITLYTLQDHKKPESVSDLFIKSILFDQSRLYYEGLINIRKDAQKSNAYQKNQNLLMSEKAWADSRPYLEILANDVRCTHGVTIGKLNKDQLYYIQTRGLSKKSATHLLATGFFADVISKIPDKSIQEKLSMRIEKKIQTLLLTD